MSLYGEPPLEHLLPAYYCNYRAIDRDQSSSGGCKGILTHLIAMVIAAGFCSGGYYYYYMVYIPILNEKFSMEAGSTPIQLKKEEIKDINFEALKLKDTPCGKNMPNENIINQINHLKGELDTFYSWRTTMNAHLSKMQWEQEVKINDAIDYALEMYEADGIGLMDYAATYAGGIIVKISRETRPHPTHRPLSLFKIVNVDVLSSPEEVIRPCVLPGSCFAFRGDRGAIRIKLGKPINIGGITLSHASKFLLGLEGMSSAPKEFEVYGFTDIDDETGTFLGKFMFDWMGNQHQTFKVQKKLSKHQIFQDVELAILNNYGKEEFTCVYRFRVHKSDEDNPEKSSQTNSGSNEKRGKKCC